MTSQSITISRTVFSCIPFINFCHPNMVKPEIYNYSFEVATNLPGYKGVDILAQLAPPTDSCSPVAEQADTFPEETAA